MTEDNSEQRANARRRLPMLADVGSSEVAHEVSAGSGQAPENPVDREQLRELVIEVLKTVYDPEIPVNIYDLGLIYRLETSDEGNVDITMTLTAPACPVAGDIVRQVADAVGNLIQVSRVRVQLVWDPPWRRERMSDAAQLELGLL